ncbi:uncharacterized protein Tgs1 [Procambarus clarkii]|uniref:uncharacterized protein Tgs1 n=1 Tax=Procambarus clarkii TaxID=6728 RepID=UPI001E672CFA|nr:uncharacterized protein LOC123745345 isoform X1 [Procambarus clarkii]XP_045581778.1 uncharacterized protein LOC123745345 isoform X2 [Procambarus clarkii]
MGLPRYIETTWCGQGMAVLKFTSKDEEAGDHCEERSAEVGKIKCYMSSHHIREYEKKTSTGADEHTDDDKSQNFVTDSEIKVDVCPPGVTPELWQSWLVHWEAWKDIYIPLSWVHKYRKHCTPDYVEWHDSYLEEYPWIIPSITDELGNSDCELDTESNLLADEMNSDEVNHIDGETIQINSHPNSKEQNSNCELNLLESNAAQNIEESEKCIDNQNSSNNIEIQTVLENSSSQNLAPKNVKKDILDSLYDKHSDKRYWVHLRNFLYGFDIEVDDGVDEFFYQKAGIHFDKSRIINNSAEQGLQNIEENVSGIVDTFGGQGEGNEHREDMEYDMKVNLQDSTIELNIKTEKQNMENTVHTFTDKQIQPTVTEGLKDLNDKNTMEHCQRTPSMDKNVVDVCVSATPVDYTSCEFMNTEPTHGESSSVACDSSEYLISEELDEAKLVMQDLTDESKNDQISEVESSVDTEEKEDESGSLPTAPLSIKKLMTKKKKKKPVKSSGRAGLGWALQYIQSQEGEIRKNGSERKSLEVTSLYPKDSAKKASSKKLKYSSEDHSNQNIYSTNEGAMSECKDEGNLNGKVNGSTSQLVCKCDRSNSASSQGINSSDESGSYDASNLVTSAVVSKCDSDKDQGETWLKRLNEIAHFTSFVVTSAFHLFGLMFPVFSGEVFKMPFQEKLPVSCESQHHSLPQNQPLDTLKGKCWNRVDKNHNKLFKWLRPLACSLPPSSTINPAEGVVLNEFRVHSEKRDYQRMYHSVEKNVADDGTTHLNLETLNLLDNEQVNDSYPVFSISNDVDHEDWTRTYTTFDEEGNAESTTSVTGLLKTQEENPEMAERATWREIISGCQIVNYGVIAESPPPDIPKDIHKYWAQRHRLFIKYDEGIKLDQESWYSVTPELIAAHHADRCRCDTVVDAFCGAGGSAIQLALTCNHVIAIDIDPEKIALARHNANVYGVADRIEFIIGDFFKLAPMLKADVVFLSPPWGGIEYLRDDVYDVRSLGGVLSCEELLAAAQAITTDIALYLPRTSNIYQIIELAGIGGTVDIEYNHMGRKKKALTAYFGDLAHY